MGAFPHRSLRVYGKSVALTELVFRITARVPRRCWFLSDQMVRAAASVALNIAEGAGEFTPREKSRFYRYARRSAAEAACALDLLHAMTGLPDDERKEAGALLEEVAAILTTMILHQNRRLQDARTSPRAPQRRPGSS